MKATVECNITIKHILEKIKVKVGKNEYEIFNFLSKIATANKI